MTGKNNGKNNGEKKQESARCYLCKRPTKEVTEKVKDGQNDPILQVCMNNDCVVGTRNTKIYEIVSVQ